jgi:hypothetical protein
MDTRPQQLGPRSTARQHEGVEINWAIVDRLTFAGQIIETGTTSYRLAHARTKRAAAS